MRPAQGREEGGPRPARGAVGASLRGGPRDRPGARPCAPPGATPCPRPAPGRPFTRDDLWALATTPEVSLAITRRRERLGENLQGEPDLQSDCRVLAEVLQRSGCSPARAGAPAGGAAGWGAPELMDLGDRVNRRHCTLYSGPPGDTDALFDAVRPSFDAAYTAYLQSRRNAIRRLDGVGTSVASIPRECKQW